MTKVAILSDLHIGVRNDSPIFYDYFKKSFDWFFSHLDSNNIRHCIVAGDLVDRRKYINILTAKRLNDDFLKPLNDRGVQTHIIPGNHDCYWKNTNDVNILDEFVAGRYENIKTYSTPTTITIDGFDFFLLPWITKETEQESIDAINNSKASVCIGHLELDGFEMQKGMLADHGYDAKIFRRFDHVLTGHYHHRSVRDNIHYIGALCEHIWSDYNDPRGFVVYDTTTRILDFHRNPFRVFHMVSYDDVKHADIMEKINATDYSAFKDCYVKVVCVNKTNPFAFDMLLEKLYKEGPADISIVEDVSMFEDSNPDDVVDQAQDTITILDNYVSGLTLPVDNDRMKTYMREVYTEALSLENVDG
jgi:DNA repair exonuclease SbcCD nuclease subunit